MEIAQYHCLRECELDAALAQSQADVAAGRYIVESVRQHVARLDALLASADDAAQVKAKQPSDKALGKKAAGKNQRRTRPIR